MVLCFFCNKIIAKKKNHNFDISFISEFLQLSADCQSEINNLAELDGDDVINEVNCEDCCILLEKGHSILDQIKNLQNELDITRDRLWGQIEISASASENDNNNLKRVINRELEQRKSERIKIGFSGGAENANLIIVENVLFKNENESEEEEFNINSTYLQFLDHENDNLDRPMEIVKEEEYNLNEGSIIIKSEESNFQSNQFNEQLNELPLPNDEDLNYENEKISQKKPITRNKKFILIPNLKTKYYCADCRKSFKNGTSLRRHYTTELHKQNKSSTSVDIIEKTGRFRCEICNIKYFDQYSLNQHLKSKKHKKALENNKTLISGDNSKDADEGNLNNEKEKEIKIDSDPLIENENEKLETNTNINWHFCRICKINYPSVPELKRHYITNFHRKNIRAFGFKCDLCNKKYATSYHLQRHFNSKSHLKANEAAAGNNIKTDSPSPSTSATGGINLQPESRYNCEPCNKYFFERYRLDEHFKTKRHLMKISSISQDSLSDQDDKNEEGNQNFEDNSSISEKITLDVDSEGEEDSSSKAKLHPGPVTKKLKCKFCNKSFKNRHTLNNHAVIHSGKKPYKCQVCGWRFNFKGYLEAHKKSHLPDEEKEFKCNQCPKAFGVKGHYKIHLLTHKSLTERPWKCNYCEKTFITNTKRKNHENIHNLIIM